MTKSLDGAAQNNQMVSDEIWHKAWIKFGNVKLIQCGQGLHPEHQSCANCFTDRRDGSA